MAQDLAWLSASLFCGKDHWNALLSKGIKPFINQLVPQKEVKSFHVQFSYASGENIRLALQTEAAQAKQLAKRMDLYFKDFFSKVNFPKKEIKLPVDGVFMPFPPNTIQYGLYKLPKEKSARALDENHLKQELSLLMIEALGEECIDEETILTFAFYLHMAWVKSVSSHHAKLEGLMGLYREDAYALPGESMDSAFLSEKYRDNEILLLGIFYDIMDQQPTGIDHIPAWLENWMGLCKRTTEKRLPSFQDKDKAFELIHLQMVHFIHTQLGITENMKRLLFYFISQIILNSNRIPNSIADAASP
jgi:hypothetical protein